MLSLAVSTVVTAALAGRGRDLALVSFERAELINRSALITRQEFDLFASRSGDRRILVPDPRRTARALALVAVGIAFVRRFSSESPADRNRRITIVLVAP